MGGLNKGGSQTLGKVRCMKDWSLDRKAVKKKLIGVHTDRGDKELISG